MMELEELPGVGGTTAAKLIDAGFREIANIATARPTDLKDAAGIGEIAASRIINAAKESMDIRFLSGKELQESGRSL